MRTAEDRITQLHKRAGQLRRVQKARRSTAAWGGMSTLLLLQLMLLTQSGTRSRKITEYVGFNGASLLDESTGGDVLVGVLAFAAGVALTAGIRWYRAKRESDRNKEKEVGDHENTSER